MTASVRGARPAHDEGSCVAWLLRLAPCHLFVRLQRCRPGSLTKADRPFLTGRRSAGLAVWRAHRRPSFAPARCSSRYSSTAPKALGRASTRPRRLAPPSSRRRAASSSSRPTFIPRRPPRSLAAWRADGSGAELRAAAGRGWPWLAQVGVSGGRCNCTCSRRVSDAWTVGRSAHNGSEHRQEGGGRRAGKKTIRHGCGEGRDATLGPDSRGGSTDGTRRRHGHADRADGRRTGAPQHRRRSTGPQDHTNAPTHRRCSRAY